MNVNLDELNDFFRYVGYEASLFAPGQPGASFAVLQQARDGCSTAGFTGVLEPLKPAMEALEQLATDVNYLLEDRLTNVSLGLLTTATAYANNEIANTEVIQQAGN